MIIGKNKVMEWVRYNKTPYWRIKRTEGDNQHKVIDSGDEENIPLEESISRLNQAFGIMSAGNYFIEAWTTKGQTKNWNRDHFQLIPETNDYVGGAQLQNMMQPQSTVDLQAEIKRGIDSYKTEVEIQELRRKVVELERENKELSNGIESALSRAYNKFEPYLGMILNVKEPAGIAVGSVQADDAQKRLEKSFEIWQDNEPDVLVIVEKIADLSKTDKGTYTMARNFLTGK